MSASYPIKFITNTVAANAAEIRISDTSDVEQTAEYDNRFNLVGGARYHRHTQDGAGGRRYVYINKTNTLSADTAVFTDFDAHLTHQVTLYSWTDYTSTIDSSIFSSSNFAETLVGPESTDWVYPFTQRTGKEAFGLELQSGTGGSYTKTVGKVFFGNAVSFSYPEAVTREPIDQRIAIGTNWHYCREAYQFVFTGLTLSAIDSFLAQSNLYTEPLFIYDAAGNWIPPKLIYGIMPSAPTVQQFDDLYSMQVQFFQLRMW